MDVTTNTVRAFGLMTYVPDPPYVVTSFYYGDWVGDPYSDLGGSITYDRSTGLLSLTTTEVQAIGPLPLNPQGFSVSGATGSNIGTVSGGGYAISSGPVTVTASTANTATAWDGTWTGTLGPGAASCGGGGYYNGSATFVLVSVPGNVIVVEYSLPGTGGTTGFVLTTSGNTGVSPDGVWTFVLNGATLTVSAIANLCVAGTFSLQ